MADLENIVQNENQVKSSQHAEGGLEAKTKKSWSEAVGEFSAWDWTKIAGVSIAGATFGGGLFGYGALNVATTTFSYILANYLVKRKKGFTKDEIQTEFVLGGVATPLIYHFFQFLDPITNPLVYGAAYFASIPPFSVVVETLQYLIEKYSPMKYVKGIFSLEPIKDISHVLKEGSSTWLKTGVKAAAWFIFPVVALHAYVPFQYMVASVVPMRTAYKYFLGKQQEGRNETNSQPDNVVPMPEKPKQNYLPKERAA